MQGFSHWVSLQATSSRRILQTARQASPTPYEKLISKKLRKTQCKLMNAMQGLLTSFPLWKNIIIIRYFSSLQSKYSK